MPLSDRQVKFLRTVQRQVRMDEAVYRKALMQLGGVEHTRDLDQAGFDVMMGFMAFCGWRDPRQAEGPDFGARPGMASYPQLELIRALWREHTRGAAGEDELCKWLLRHFKVTHLRFLTLDQARKAITALKAMKGRPGFAGG